MPRILSTATAVPSQIVSQGTAKQKMAEVCRGRPDLERLLRVFDRAGVETRHLVHSPDWYLENRTFDERNMEYLVHGGDLAERAARACLDSAEISPAEVDHLFFVTTTGLATPSLDAGLVARLGMRNTTSRVPLFGLGCAGGAGGVSRACDVLRGNPRARALVVSVELCSLVFSTSALTPTDLIGAALFGDGAAAVLLGGDDIDSPGIEITSTRTTLFPEAQHLMGWQFTSDGMRLVLSREIPAFVRDRVSPLVSDFLAASNLRACDLAHSILHPGGPGVLETYHSAFGLPSGALETARQSLCRFGNLSSASVLFMLDAVSRGHTAPGDVGLMLALGPGFAAEMLLLSW